MRHRKLRLTLFFALQILAVATMGFLPRANRHRFCGADGCAQSSVASVVIAILVILGELWAVAATLHVDGPIRKSLLGLGILSLIVAVYISMVSMSMHDSNDVAQVIALWHLVAGLLLFGTGAIASLSRLLVPSTPPAQPNLDR